MSVPPYLYPLAAPLLIPVARQLGKQLISLMGNGRPSREDSSDVSTVIEQVHDDPQMVHTLVEYSQRKETRIQELRSLSVTQTERRLELQKQELGDRLEISRLQRKLLREVQANAIKLKLHELDEIWNREKWFSNLSRQETERILLEGQEHHRLLMLVAPPELSEDCPASMRRHLKKDIDNGLRRFLSHYYPIASDLCPVEFYADYFNRPLGDIEVRKLQNVLSPVPTFILYSDINDYEVNFHIGCWGLQHHNVSLIPIAPWDWEEAKENLQAKGLPERLALRQIRQLIVTIHKLLAAFLTDWYYLSLDPNYKPRLFGMNSEFPEAWMAPYVAILREIQQQRRKTHEYELQQLVAREAERREIQFKRNPQNWHLSLVMTGHAKMVTSVAIAPNNNTIISGSWDNTVKVWSARTGELLRTLSGHSGAVNAIAVSPDSERLVSASSDGTVRIWSLETGKSLQILTGHAYAVSSAAISPDGRFIVSGSWDNTLKIWSLETGELRQTLLGHVNSINAVAIGSESRWIASGSVDGTVKMWSLETGEFQRTLFEHSQGIKAIAIGPDSRWLVSSGWDETIAIHTFPRADTDGFLENSELRQTLNGHERQVFALAISPDSQYIASGSSDRSIRIWSLETGYLLRTLTGHLHGVNAIAFSPTGFFLTSGSSDGTIRVWCQKN